MRCRKCRAEIPENSKFCSQCGAKQATEHNPKRRGNGQGSVYKRANGSWMAIKTVKMEPTPDGRVKRTTRSKSGFRTKREALEYLPLLDLAPRRPRTAFSDVFERWEPTHRAGKSTMDCYRAAYRYYAPLWDLEFSEITIDDLQDCVDDCPKGRRTKENMKALAGLLYKYAIPRNLVTLNLGQYLVVSGDSGGGKDGLPDEALRALERAAGTVDGADYILCQCYLGFRPSEFLALDAANYNRKERAFVGGSKTDAGRDRIVTVSPKIQPIIDRLLLNRVSGPVFPAEGGGRMSIAAYRAMFYRVLRDCGIDNPTEERGGVTYHRYTPHSCRHTFATLMKRVSGADKDKLELMGHTSTEMLRHYQDTSFDDLRRVTDAL